MQYNFNFSEVEILTFALVLLRCSAFLVTWPVFGSGVVPQKVKILLAVLISFIVFPVVSKFYAPEIVMSEELVSLTIKEVFVGFLLGFICRMFFFAISIMGDIVSVSMGLQSAQIMNPSLGTQSGVIEQFQATLATLLFLAINGHHLFIGGMIESFEIVAITSHSFDFSLFATFGKFVQEIVMIGIKMASPVMISILFMNIAMGIIGRAVPQINVLITSLPANILLGLTILLVSLPLFVHEMESLVSIMTERLFQVMKGI